MVQSTTSDNKGQEPYKYSGDTTTLLSKYDLPITHLDFSYVEKCNDGKELEKILHVLISGQEGYYPELIKAVEEKLKILLPKSRFLRSTEKVIGEEDLDKEEWNMINKDISEWVNNISRDNKELELRKGGNNSDHPCRPDIRKSGTIANEKESKTEKRIRSTDYASWDKYDPDTEILKMDLADEKVKKEAVENLPKKKIKKQVKFNSFATEAEANYEANREREKGNEYFKAGEYSSAVIHYTASLECKTTVQCLNNRAIAYIKKEQYQKAIDDCDSALAIESENFKANFRKAQALEELKRFQEGLEYIEKCVLINPNNSTVQELAERIRTKCGVRLEKKRFAIQDVQKQKDQKKGILKDKIYGKTASKLQENFQSNTRKQNWLSKAENKKTTLIPIPGTSRMPEPYYVTCSLEEAQNTLHQIQDRSQILGFISTLPEDEEECPINHLNHICSNSELQLLNSSSVDENHQTLERREDYSSTEEICIRTKFQKSNKIITKKLEEIHLNDKDAGGEPYKREDVMALPEDIQSPYTFLKTWTSIGNDTSYKKHAHILKNINMDQLEQVIGCKLDNDMFSTILRTLCMHFTVPGQVEKVRSILVNIARLPRFQIISMLMSQEDQNCVNNLTSFLNQHDSCLPQDVREFLNQ